jgi:acetyl-CoA hydrolase
MELVDVPDTDEVDLDLRRWIRPGDTVLWGQGTAEPVPLVRALIAQRAEIGPVRVFAGLAYTSYLRPEHADFLTICSYGAIGPFGELARAGVLDVIPTHVSQIPRLFTDGQVRPDVVLVQVAPADEDGTHSLGVGMDYLPAALAEARTVIAEVNERVPRTFGAYRLPASRIDVAVPTSRPLIQVRSAPPDAVDDLIAKHVAGLVPEGATIETGIGRLPDAILAALADRPGLSIYSGMITDAAVDLAERGALRPLGGAHGQVAIATGTAAGTDRLYDFVDRNPVVRFLPVTETHGEEALGSIERFTAINSAVEVDITGQINGETAGGRYVGAVGGQVDFMRGATRSPGGLSIIALPSATSGGKRSRITRRTDGTVTTPRSDADYVVTEHGVAALRGRTLRQRAEAMIAIAHPDFRAELAE